MYFKNDLQSVFLEHLSAEKQYLLNITYALILVLPHSSAQLISSQFGLDSAQAGTLLGWLGLWDFWNRSLSVSNYVLRDFTRFESTKYHL